MKCFDTIHREGLWLKHFRSDIKGKVLRIFWNIYQQAKSCVKLRSTCSNFFQYAIGLRQGEVIYPILFLHYLSNILSYFFKQTLTRA